MNRTRCLRRSQPFVRVVQRLAPCRLTARPISVSTPRPQAAVGAPWCGGVLGHAERIISGCWTGWKDETVPNSA